MTVEYQESGNNVVMLLTDSTQVEGSYIVLGDASGGAKVDCQMAGLLGYKELNQTVNTAGIWRDLDVNYPPQFELCSFVYDVAERGFLLGVTFNLK